LSDKKGAGAGIGGSSFDALSGNATTVAKITCLLNSLQFSAQVRPSNPRQDEVWRRMLNDLWACSASIVLKTWCAEWIRYSEHGFGRVVADSFSNI
jgi:hypothetical protein